MAETPLTAWHEEHGARMIDFHGWRMPLQYTSITDECRAVRRAAGIFDLGHMGRIRLRGKDCLRLAQQLTTVNVERMQEGRVCYGFICNYQGGVIDDVTVYRASDYLMVVANASNRKRVVDWMERNRADLEVEIDDSTETLGMIAVQGPLAEAILQEMSDLSLGAIGYYHFEIGAICDAKMIVSRTGYTGEDGFELYMGSFYCRQVWETLLERGRDRGLVPAGLGARDTLRIEAAMPLYGNELSESVTPYEAGLGRHVDLNKGDFIGRQALVECSQSHLARKLVCLAMQERAIARKGHEIFVGDMRVGHVTSGTFSPTLGQAIAMAYVDVLYAEPGTRVEVEIRGKRQQALVVHRPFYKRRSN